MKRSLKEMRSLLTAATPGKWEYCPNGMMEPPTVESDGRLVASVFTSDDTARFIAAAPEIVSDLLGLVEAMRDAAKGIDEHLELSGSLKAVHAVWTSPAEALRRQAEAIDKRDAAIRRFKSLLAKLDAEGGSE